MRRSVVPPAQCFHTTCLRHKGRLTRKEMLKAPKKKHLPPVSAKVPIPKRPRERQTPDSGSLEKLDRIRRSLLSKGLGAKVNKPFVSKQKAESLYEALMHGSTRSDKSEEQNKEEDAPDDQDSVSSVMLQNETGMKSSENNNIEGEKLRSESDKEYHMDMTERDKLMIYHEGRMHNLLVNKKPSKALQYLEIVKNTGFEPSATCYFSAVRACYALDKESLVDNASPLTVTKAFRAMMMSHGVDEYGHLGISAKVMVAKLHCWRGEYMRALCIMRFDANLAAVDLDKAVSNMKLGGNAVAWMTVMDLLNKSDRGHYVAHIFDHMVLAGITPTNAAYALLITSYGASANRHAIIETLEAMLRNGVQPTPSTIGLAIKLLARGTPPNWVAERIPEFVQLIDNPAPLFATTILRACGRTGAFNTALKMFDQLSKSSPNGIPDEGSYLSVLLAGAKAAFIKFKEQGATTEVSSTSESGDVDLAKRGEGVASFFDRVNTVADKTWKEYVDHYAGTEPAVKFRIARSRMLQSYILVKTRTLRTEEALSLIEKSLSSQYAWHKFQHCGPFVSVLYNLEQDGHMASKLVPRILKLLEEARVKLNLTGISYGIGALVKEGKHQDALMFLRQCENRLKEIALEDAGTKEAIAKFAFVKRMQMLLDACEANSAPVSTMNFLRTWSSCFQG